MDMTSPTKGKAAQPYKSSENPHQGKTVGYGALSKEDFWEWVMVGVLPGDQAAPTASPSPIQIREGTPGPVQVTLLSHLEPDASHRCWGQGCHRNDASHGLFLTSLGLKPSLKTLAGWLSPLRGAQLPALKHLQTQAPWKSFPALQMDAKGVFSKF